MIESRCNPANFSMLVTRKRSVAERKYFTAHGWLGSCTRMPSAIAAACRRLPAITARVCPPRRARWVKTRSTTRWTSATVLCTDSPSGPSDPVPSSTYSAFSAGEPAPSERAAGSRERESW